MAIFFAGLSASAGQQYSIPVNPVQNLSAMTRSDIIDLRRKLIAQHAALRLFPNVYTPHERVYNRMTDRTEWVNDTQFFIANPYLLVLESGANYINPLAIYCGYKEAYYTDNRIEVRYIGEFAKKWFEAVFDYYGQTSGMIRLWFVNAYDAGYMFASIDTDRSTNISLTWPERPDAMIRTVVTGMEYFHVGKYNKNNISPPDDRKKLKILERNKPTVIYIKLWKQRPADKNAPEDLAYVISIRP